MKFITFFCAVSILFFGALANSYSIEYHHSQPSNYYSTTNETVISGKGIALGIAAAQHHYKATTALQWSIGGGNYDGSSAVSGGLGLQAGKVFVSGNISSDGRTSAIGIGASGTF